jgi:hypothetical protein
MLLRSMPQWHAAYEGKGVKVMATKKKATKKKATKKACCSKKK